MITRVVFDLGGVVFNWQPRQVLRQLLPHRIHSEAQAGHWAGEIFQSFHPDCDWARFDLGLIEPPALADRIARRTGLTVQEMLTVIEGIVPLLTPMAGTLAIIEALHARGTPLFYLSNMPAGYAQALVGRHPFFACFADGIFSADVQQMKPEARIYATADKRFGAAGAGTLFIDDTHLNIAAARVHGWQALHFEHPQQCQQQLQALGLL